MRTAEEIINSYPRRGYGYIKKDILSAINEAQQEAYNQAIQDAAKLVREYDIPEGEDPYTQSLKSLLALKIENIKNPHN